MEVVIFFSIVFLLAICITFFIMWCFMAKRMADIAEMKGHGRSPWFAWTFWFGIFGMLLVIALPDRVGLPVQNSSFSGSIDPQKEVVSNELPDL